MGSAMHVTDVNFEETLKKNSLVVVDCWASWCGPCMKLAPTIDELAQEYSGRVLFGKLNVDENRAVPSSFGVMSIPTLLVFKDGKLVDRLVGALPKQMIEEKLKPHI